MFGSGSRLERLPDASSRVHDQLDRHPQFFVARSGFRAFIISFMSSLKRGNLPLSTMRPDIAPGRRHHLSSFI